MRCRLAATLLAFAACGDSAPSGPYDGIDPSKTITGEGLSAPVDLVRDEYGIPHILAKTEEDAAYANGYVVAADRWMQLDLLRHLASGRIAELFGGLDADQVASDLAMRMHAFAARAQAQYDLLAGSSEPDAQAAARYIQRYADGVNAVIGELQSGVRDLDEYQTAYLAPETIEPWSPADSVAVGLLQAWSLSYLEGDVELSAARAAGEAGFVGNADPERAARARAFDDLFPMGQLDTVATIDGWPAGGTMARPAPAADTPPRQTRPSLALLEQARRAVRPIEALGMTWPHPENGSNNWVVGPSLAGGKTLLANDPHLQLASPPLFHAIHLTVPGELDVSGISLAGVPGVVLGHTAGLAWGATTTYHDVLDFHHEVIAPCTSGGGNCVTYDGNEVRLETRTETIAIGTFGLISDSVNVTYEVVPHHGPILPNIVDNAIIPRAGAEGISVHFTGYQTTRELLALYRLNRAQTVAEGFAAMDTFDHGSQNWVMADTQGAIGWTTSSQLPVRSPGCMTWDPATGVGDAPFFVLPGDGSCKWTGNLSPEFVPHAIDPASGFLVTANADPIGETFDGNPINGPHYAGWDYGPGFRQGRITRRLQGLVDGGAPLTLDDLASVQADTHSNTGARLRPFIIAAVDDLAAELAAPGTHPDIASFATGLPAGVPAALAAMGQRLEDWSLDAAAGGAGASADQVRDASATTIFNFWQIEFYDLAFGDELAVLGGFPDRSFTIPAAIRALEDPSSLHTGTLPGDPTSARLCDDLGTVGYETCRLMILRALDAARVEAQGRFTSTNPDEWTWGELHVATVNSLLPADSLSLPGPGNPPYPRPGDTHAVDASNNSVSSYTFAYGHGPAMRNLVELSPDGTIVQRWALPGGQVFDTRSPHFRDQMDQFWSKNLYADVPWLPAQIIEKAEARWVFRP